MFFVNGLLILTAKYLPAYYQNLSSKRGKFLSKAPYQKSTCYTTNAPYIEIYVSKVRYTGGAYWEPGKYIVASIG